MVKHETVEEFLARGGAIKRVARDVRPYTEQQLKSAARGELVEPLSEEQQDENARQAAFERAWHGAR